MSNQIMISLNMIRKHNPCTEGWETMLKARGKTKADDVLFPIADIAESNGIDDALWCTRCLPEYANLWRKFAVWSAVQVKHLMEDERSFKALEIAWQHSCGNASDDELDTARAAAVDAAGAAARAAARAAAWDAARAAAVDAAWDTAGDAARDAAWDTARDAQKRMFIHIANGGEIIYPLGD